MGIQLSSKPQEPRSPSPVNESELDDGFGAGAVPAIAPVSLEDQNSLRCKLRSKLRRNRRSRSKRDLLVRKNTKAKRKSVSSTEGSSKSKKRRAPSEVPNDAKAMDGDAALGDESDHEHDAKGPKAKIGAAKAKAKSKAKASPSLPLPKAKAKAKAKSKAKAKCEAKAKATPKAKGKAKAKATAAPKDGRKSNKSKAKWALEDGDRLSPDRKRTGLSKCGFFVLGCSSCRWSHKGCGTCLRPSFNGWRWNPVALGENDM